MSMLLSRRSFVTGVLGVGIALTAGPPTARAEKPVITVYRDPG